MAGSHAARSRRPDRRVLGAALTGVLILAATLGAASVRSAAAVVGFRDHAYPAAGPMNRATADKPQSKVWYTDGIWYGVLWHQGTTLTDGFRIHRLDTATQSWVVAGGAADLDTRLDARETSNADALWVEATQTLYVVSTADVVGGQIRMWRFTYDAATNRFDHQLGPVTIAAPGTETVTIARDSTGQLWIAYPGTGAEIGQVRIASSEDGGANWSLFALPMTSQGELARTDVAEDIAAIVAFPSAANGPRIGVLWNNSRVGATQGVFLAVHDDDDPDGTWQPREIAISGTESGDDHLNVKASSDGRLFVAAKTGLDGNPNTSLPLGRLLMRNAAGAWSAHTFDTVADDGTRAQVVVNEELDVVYVVLGQPTNGGVIRMKSAGWDDLDAAASGGPAAFAPGTGAAFIANGATDPAISDPSTAKQPATAASGLLAIASDRTTKRYLHNRLPLAASDTTGPTGGSVVVNAGAAATASRSVTVVATATDAGSGVAQVRLSNSSTTSGGVLSSGTTFAATAAAIPWTLADLDGDRVVYAQFRDTAGNWSAVVSDIIRLDRGAPTISGAATPAANAAGWRNAPVTVTFTCADALTGIASCTAPVVLSADGANQSVQGTATDGAGNTAMTTVSDIDIDRTAPTSTAALSPVTPASGWHTGSVTVTLAAADALSGVDRIEQRVDGGAWTTYGGPFAVSGTGTHTVERRAVDEAGNVQVAQATTIRIDAAAPSGSIVIAGGAAETQTLEVLVSGTATDAGSGPSQLRLSNSSATTGGVLSSGATFAYGGAKGWTLLPGDGTKTVFAQFRDVAGNWSAVVSDTIVVDTSGPPPAGTVAIAGGAAATKTTSVTVNLSKPAADVTHVRISTSPTLSGGVLAGTTPIAYAPSIARTLPGGDGTKALYVQWIDDEGNHSPVASDTIVLDTVLPTATAPKPSFLVGTKQSSGLPVRLAWTANGTGSAVSFQVLASRNGGAYTVLTSTSARSVVLNLGAGASWRLRVRAIDAAGNAALGPASVAFTPRAYQESSTAVRYGSGWRRASSTAFWGGTSRYATVRGSRATFTFTGRSVAVVAPKSPVRGSARVYVDGRYISTVSLYATTLQPKVLVFSRAWASSGRHTVTIIVNGTTGRPRIDLDGFAVLQ